MTKGSAAYLGGALTLTLLVLAPVIIELASYFSENAGEKRDNEQALEDEREDLDNLVATLKSMPPGRVFAGLTAESGDRWGAGYSVGDTPVAQILGVAGFDIFSATLH